MTVKPHVPSRSAISVLLGAAVALALSACGGGSSHTTTNAAAETPSGPTKAEFVAKANAVCEATNGPLTRTALKLETQRNPAVAAKIVARPLFRRSSPRPARSRPSAPRSAVRPRSRPWTGC